MRKKFSGFTCLTTAAALTVSACGGDPTGVNSGDPLTSAEVAAVISAIGSAFESAGAAAQRVSTVGFDGASAGQDPVAINENFDVSVPCESGTVQVSGSISGTVDDVTSAVDITTDVSWDPNGCVISDDTNTLTVDGAPEIKLVLDMTSTENTLTMNGTETGGFSFTVSDGRSGSCSLDVTFTIATDATGIDASVSGTICGLEASAFETLGT